MAFLSRHISYYERRRGDLLDAVPHLWVLDGFDQGCQEGADWTNDYCDGISEKVIYRHNMDISTTTTNMSQKCSNKTFVANILM